MKAKHLYPAIAALLAAGGLWFAWNAWRSADLTIHKSSKGVALKTPGGPNSDSNTATSLAKASQMGPTNRPTPGQVLRPPTPNRRFADFTPEQRVEFARKGRGPGG